MSHSPIDIKPQEAPKGAKKETSVSVFVWIFSAAALAVVPMLILGNAWGHDFDFHLSMWMDAAQQVRQGVLIPRWTALANSGFGEPSVMFYPPLSWVAATILGLILPWKLVPCVFIFFALGLAGMAMWKLAREWLSPRDALAAALLYAWNPYILVDAVKRADFAELLAVALIPLLAWAAIRLAQDGRGMIAPLAAIYAAIWLSNLPAGMIASYSLALLLALQCIFIRSWRPAIHGAIAIVLAFGCTAFFLLPTQIERPWVETGLAFIPEWAPPANYLFTRNPNFIMQQMNQALSWVAVGLMILSAIAAVLILRSSSGKTDAQSSRIRNSIMILGAASAFVMFRASSIIWKVLPDFEFIEYPWRWLSVLTTAAMFLIAAGIATFRRKTIWWVLAALGTVGVWGGLLYTVRWDHGSRQIANLAAEAQSGQGYRFPENLDWRKPQGSHPSKLPDFAPEVAVAGDAQGVQFTVEQWKPNRKIFSVNSAHPASLRIKLLNYPAWRARWNGTNLPLETDPQTGQMLLTTPGGAGRVEIDIARTWDRVAGAAISGVSVLILIGLAIKWREKQLD